ncbi:MAG: exodeoxyribonuclease VII large subunit [Phycisphaerales bacterium]|nr:exodeoxyribonuclease VII large subunit [Phycisphaerales bacterium]
MSRKPFDPERAEGDANLFDRPSRRDRRQLGGLHEADRISVGQLSELIKQTLEGRLPSPLRVVGEISNFTDRKHWYFSLKDSDAVISCVAWASSVARITTTPRDGDAVVATGYVSHYGPQGRTQLYVSHLEPVGTGSLEQQFRALCDELRGLGYFEESRKVRLPSFPRRIAVITSRTSAALQDVMATAAHRCPLAGLLVVDVRVQGEAASVEIARAIRRIDANAEALGVDAILVTRGGGSLEDLWAFNERNVADATLDCTTPIVAAIGHESDTTIIELVADVRAATPTQAVMRLVPDREDLMRQLDHQTSRLRSLMRRRIERGRERVMSVARFPAFRDPRGVIVLARSRCDDRAHRLRAAIRSALQRRALRLEQRIGRFAGLRPAAQFAQRRGHVVHMTERLRRTMRWRLERSRQRVDGVERAMAAVDHRSVLHRGYSITMRATGGVVRSAADVRAGDELVTQVQDGRLRSMVVEDGGERAAGGSVRGTSTSSEGAASERKRPSKRDSGGDAPQLDLFGGAG